MTNNFYTTTDPVPSINTSWFIQHILSSAEIMEEKKLYEPDMMCVLSMLRSHWGFELIYYTLTVLTKTMQDKNNEKRDVSLRIWDVGKRTLGVKSRFCTEHCDVLNRYTSNNHRQPRAEAMGSDLTCQASMGFSWFASVLGFSLASGPRRPQPLNFHFPPWSAEEQSRWHYGLQPAVGACQLRSHNFLLTVTFFMKLWVAHDDVEGACLIHAKLTIQAVVV